MSRSSLLISSLFAIAFVAWNFGIYGSPLDDWPWLVQASLTMMGLASFGWGCWLCGTGHRRAAWLLGLAECEIITVEGGRHFGVVNTDNGGTLIYELPSDMQHLPDHTHIIRRLNHGPICVAPRLPQPDPDQN